jgi:hypothetical protein
VPARPRQTGSRQQFDHQQVDLVVAVVKIQPADVQTGIGDDAHRRRDERPIQIRRVTGNMLRIR